uniref:DUF38 domain-containing protein n=1 Tax=Panagrolaimus davidi TaxID=227884 RepID=A0A914PGB0_9BILA
MKSLKLCIDKNFPIKKLIVQRQFKSSSRQYILSSFIFSRILFCNLIEISIEYNKITWNEYLLLTNSERVEKLALEGVDVTDTKNNQVPVDMLMSRIPLAYEIDIQPCYFAPKTNLNLLLLNRKTTISKLNFVNIYGNFDSESFYSFLKNVLTPTAETLIHFRYNEINNQINENFIEELKELSINDQWYKTFHMDYPRNLNAPKPESMETLMSFINSN